MPAFLDFLGTGLGETDGECLVVERSNLIMVLEDLLPTFTGLTMVFLFFVKFSKNTIFYYLLRKMEKHERWFKKIFEEVIKEFHKSFEENEKVENTIHQLISDIRKKSFHLVKTNCKEDLEWFEKNGKVSIDEDSFNLHVEQVEIGDDVNFHMKEFEDCVKDYKLDNLDVEMEKLITESNNIVKSNQVCTSNCMKNFKKMTDKDMKICFTKCFNISTKKSLQINNEHVEILKKQLNDINKLL